MGENTKIEWAHHTINFWWGCEKVSEGCANCYAEKQSSRFGDVWGRHKPRRMINGAVEMAIRLNNKAYKNGVRYRVFSQSMSDFFETDHGQPIIDSKGEQVFVDDQGLHPMTISHLREIAFNVIEKTTYLDWQIVTKRPENIRSMWVPRTDFTDELELVEQPYRSNVWLLTSVENQEQADKRIPELLKCRDLATVLGLSCEPLLGPVDLIAPIVRVLAGEQTITFAGACPIDWVIDGNESGPGARPGHVQWSRSLRNQCLDWGMAYFKKQWGEWVPESEMPSSIDTCPTHIRIDLLGNDVTDLAGLWNEADCHLRRVGKAKSGRSLDGVEWNQFPQLAEA